ncbi:uncharacterized protein LOC132309843 [Cornus florida]|uniref:uncharacterized protein LOC132309843 n=1 Tax=Cornus florida TaxID=4283 RepID=UPI0028995523|nr:uncharacterized protein LOC132309843 [Cornus florida]
MASELFVFDASFYSDPFSPFSASTIDVLQTIDNNNNTTLQNPVDLTNCFNQITLDFLSSSPPTRQVENLTLCQATHLKIASNSANPFTESSALEVKAEECQLGFQPSYNHQSFEPQSYGGPENAVKMMQRSFSSNYVDGKPEFLYQSGFDNFINSPIFQPQVLSSPKNSCATGQIRNACSTGDLQKMKTNHRLSLSPLAAESSIMVGEIFKARRYSAKERKERIHKYRAKRTHRNFNKTIKYACRKTLADSRIRIRGRFARNDEIGEVSKAANMNQCEEEDDLWHLLLDYFESVALYCRKSLGMLCGQSRPGNHSYSAFLLQSGFNTI